MYGLSWLCFELFWNSLPYPDWSGVYINLPTECWVIHGLFYTADTKLNWE